MRNGLSLDLSKVQPYASLSELDKMEGLVKFLMIQFMRVLVLEMTF